MSVRVRVCVQVASLEVVVQPPNNSRTNSHVFLLQVWDVNLCTIPVCVSECVSMDVRPSARRFWLSAACRASCRLPLCRLSRDSSPWIQRDSFWDGDYLTTQLILVERSLECEFMGKLLIRLKFCQITQFESLEFQQKAFSLSQNRKHVFFQISLILKRF